MSHTKVELLVKKLSIRGIVPIRVTKGSRWNPEAIWITDTIYIEVSDNGVVVFNNSLEGLSIYETTHDINEVIASLKKVI